MASHPEFGERTTAEEVVNTFGSRVTGKIILITGVSPNSIGLATAMAIASQNPSLIILASRSLSNLSTVVNDIKSAFPSVQTRTLFMDLLSMESVRAAADEVLAYPESSIDILINNAGLMDPRPLRRVSDDGLEQHMAINHLGHFLFTNLVMSKLRAAAAATGEARIVVVASSSAAISPIRFSDFNVEKASMDVTEAEQPNLGMLQYLQIPTENPYLGWVAYGQSKTANILATVKWAEILKDDGIIALCLHPGVIRTNLQRTTVDEDLGLAAQMFWKTTSQGASTTLVAAFDPGLKEVSGAYLDNCQLADAPEYATDKDIAERLWNLSEELVGQSFK